MLKILGLLMLAIVIAFAAYVALLPPVGTITRSATVPAPPAAVFPYVNDLHKWQEWSPWAKVDPNAKIAFDGPSSGIGSAFSWAGNNEIGEGKMTIEDSKLNEHVKIRLDFAKPFASRSDAIFDLKPDGAGTNVTWTMTGERPFLARIMCTLFQADKMVGDMFEKGLANLGKVVAAPPTPAGGSTP